jgi:hypothetical protein
MSIKTFDDNESIFSDRSSIPRSVNRDNEGHSIYNLSRENIDKLLFDKKKYKNRISEQRDQIKQLETKHDQDIISLKEYYQNKISQMSENAKILKSKVSVLEQENTLLKSETEISNNSKTEKLETKVKTLEEHIKFLTQETAEKIQLKEQEIQMLHRKIHELSSENQTKISKCIRETEILAEKNIESLKAKFDQERTEYRTIKDSLTKQISQLQQELNDTENKHKQVVENITSENYRTISELNISLSELREKYNKDTKSLREQFNAKLENTNIKHEQEKRVLKENSEKRLEEIKKICDETVKFEKLSHNRVVLELETSRDKLDSEKSKIIDKLQTMVDSKTEMIKVLQEKSKMSETVTIARVDIQYKTRIEQYKTQISDFEHTVINLREQQEKYKEILVNMDKDNTKIKLEMIEKINNLEHEKTELSKNCQEQINLLKLEIHKLKETLLTKENVILRLTNDIKHEKTIKMQLENQLSILSDKVTESETKQEELKTTVEDLEFKRNLLIEKLHDCNLQLGTEKYGRFT